MQLDLDSQALKVIHALDSQTRIVIVNQLAKQPMTVTNLATFLHYSKAIISKHIKALKEAQIIYETESTTGDRRQKVLAVKTESILINLPEKIYPEFERIDHEIPYGNYFAVTDIAPTCGMASTQAVIGEMDDPDVFLSPERLSASLLWFSQGSVEYVFPNSMKGHQPELIDISFELSSEFPVSNNNWPSDITFWLNDIELGTLTVPANFSDVRGKLTPNWWPSNYSQYGLLKHLRIHQTDTGIDGRRLSSIRLQDLALNTSTTLAFRIGIKKQSPHQGGLTLFGSGFGNHPQSLHVTCFYTN